MALLTDLRPPFTLATATDKVRAAENAWNSREASINDVAITENERKFFWDAPGPRPADHVGIADVK